MNNTKSRKLKNYYASDSVYGIRNNLAYYKHLRDLLDAHKTKQASIEFRKKVIDNQRNLNYQLEYDRLRNFINNQPLHTTIETLNRRKAWLERHKDAFTQNVRIPEIENEIEYNKKLLR
jgi:signal transduction histidine kinase